MKTLRGVGFGGWGFDVGLGLGVYGLRFRDWGLGIRDSGLGIRIWDFISLEVYDVVLGSGLGDWGFGMWD